MALGAQIAVSPTAKALKTLTSGCRCAPADLKVAQVIGAVMLHSAACTARALAQDSEEVRAGADEAVRVLLSRI